MAMLWFQELREYEYAMRVDEDVCITRLPHPVLDSALAADYAYGLETPESHFETIATFVPWVRAYLDAEGLVPTFPPLPTENMFFTNFFVSRVAWWRSPQVARFLNHVNKSGGIYVHRCSNPNSNPNRRKRAISFNIQSL